MLLGQSLGIVKFVKQQQFSAPVRDVPVLTFKVSVVESGPATADSIYPGTHHTIKIQHTDEREPNTGSTLSNTDSRLMLTTHPVDVLRNSCVDTRCFLICTSKAPRDHTN